MRSLGVGMLVIALAACGSSESSPTTAVAPADTATTIASTTSVPATSVSATSVPVTTVLVTTAPPTTIASTTAAPATTLAPTAVAEQEILARLDAFTSAIDACWADARACDMGALLDEYVVPDDVAIREFQMNAWESFDESGLLNVNEGRVDRSVASIEVGDDATAGSTHMCEVNSAFDVPRPDATSAPTTVPPSIEPIYAQYYYEWAKQPDGRWLITHSEWTFGWTPNDMSEGEAPSLSPDDLAQCFA